MTSLPRSNADQVDEREAPFARSAGLANTLPKAADPVAAWIDLMQTIEALGTRLPARSSRLDGDYRL